MMLIHGRCHCSNISYSLIWEPEPTTISARVCGCSFCVKHGGVWTTKPDGVLTVVVNDLALLSNYRFGTQTADFHVCIRCGTVPLVTSRIDDRLYAVVNVNTFEGVDPSLIVRAPANFDDEDSASRLSRRQRHWIADVKFVGVGAGEW